MLNATISAYVAQMVFLITISIQYTPTTTFGNKTHFSNSTGSNFH